MATIGIASGRNVHFDDAGIGRTVVMIPGRTAPRTMLEPEFERLSSDFRVIIPDNRDAGENDPETEPYTISDIADDVAGLLRALGIQRAHVLGGMWGGCIAQEFALRHADMLDRLVLVSTTPVTSEPNATSSPMPPPEEWWMEDPVERWRAELPLDTAPGYFDDKPDLLDREAERYRGNRITWEGRMRQVAAGGQFDVRDRLHEITAPTLVLHGDQDPYIPVQNAELIANRIPNALLRIIRGAGHLLFIERPEEMEHTVRGFLLEV
jgi:3-oxoadipate enol-lactonase